MHNGASAPGGASLANWQTPPHNRWAFHHIAGIIASADIANSVQQRAYQSATGWVPAGPREPGELGVIAEVQKDLRSWFKRLHGPGARHGGPFKYVSANTDLLGWAIERATGQSIASLLGTRLWKPMGAQHAAYVTVDNKGLARYTGGLCATARDFARPWP